MNQSITCYLQTSTRLLLLNDLVWVYLIQINIWDNKLSDQKARCPNISLRAQQNYIDLKENSENHRLVFISFRVNSRMKPCNHFQSDQDSSWYQGKISCSIVGMMPGNIKISLSPRFTLPVFHMHKIKPKMEQFKMY